MLSATLDSILQIIGRRRGFDRLDAFFLSISETVGFCGRKNPQSRILDHSLAPDGGGSLPR